jgi:hypothetical protein
MEHLAGAHFRRVRREDFTGVTVVPTAAPLVDFLDSTRALRGVDDAVFDAVLGHAAAEIASAIDRDGAFSFTNHIGLITAEG